MHLLYCNIFFFLLSSSTQIVFSSYNLHVILCIIYVLSFFFFNTSISVCVYARGIIFGWHALRGLWNVHPQITIFTRPRRGETSSRYRNATRSTLVLSRCQGVANDTRDFNNNNNRKTKEIGLRKKGNSCAGEIKMFRCAMEKRKNSKLQRVTPCKKRTRI